MNKQINDKIINNGLFYMKNKTQLKLRELTVSNVN